MTNAVVNIILLELENHGCYYPLCVSEPEGDITLLLIGTDFTNSWINYLGE